MWRWASTGPLNGRGIILLCISQLSEPRPVGGTTRKPARTPSEGDLLTVRAAQGWNSGTQGSELPVTGAILAEPWRPPVRKIMGRRQGAGIQTLNGWRGKTSLCCAFLIRASGSPSWESFWSLLTLPCPCSPFS